jgi:predicted ATPase/DNA-binding SARP family transcriptional activator
MTDLLEMSLLGEVTLKLSEKPLTGLASHRTEALLIYLACTGRPHNREALANLLWDNRSQRQALGNLRVLLTSLRQTLGPYVTITRQTVAFNQDSSYWLDVVELEEGLAAVRGQRTQDVPLSPEEMAQLAQTLTLYQGDFLQGFYLRGCRDFEEWQVTERERLRLQTIEALHDLVDGYLTAGNYLAGLKQARHLLQLDPLREKTHRSLMLLLAYRGQRNAALTQYETCCRILADELDVEPMAETTALYEQIKAEELSREAEGNFEASQSRLAPPADTIAPSSSAPSHNLPEQPTPFIGREQEVTTACDIFMREGVRLLNLTGPGGTGKTRLGLQVATELLDHFQQGVFFVSLADITSPDLVVSKIAQPLDLREAGSRPLLEILKDYLRDKQMLLLLDNFEHVIIAAPVVADLLATAPGLKVLVTSRAPLNLRGEHEFLVPPLKLPDPMRLPSLEHLNQYEAVQLFTERAQVAKASFAISNENAPAVAKICYHLDGLPLAIELAAAHIKLLPPQTLLERLSSRLKLLIGGAQDLPVRQQTLRNTIDWSYSLLTKDEQVLFVRLGVFIGGCTLEAAEAICTLEGSPSTQAEPALNILEGVESLINKSLLQQEEVENGRPRFRMLETIREYALERLLGSGEMEIMRRQHARYFANFSEEAGQKLFSSEANNWLVTLEAEHDNLRAALDWSHLVPDGVEIGPRIIGSIWWFWYRRGYLSEARERFERVLALADLATPTATRASMLLGGGLLAMWQGNLATARPMIEESVTIWRWLENGLGLALALMGNGVLLINQGDDMAARPLLEESLAICEEFELRWLQAITLMHLGNVAMGLGDYAQARIWLEQSSSLAQQFGDSWVIASVLNNLGELARCLQDYDRACGYYEESGTLFRETDDKPDVARSIHSLGYVAQYQGDYKRAEAQFRESLALFRKLGNNRGIAECIAGLAGLAIEQTQVKRAGRLLSMAKTLLGTLGAAWWPADRIEYERNLVAIRAASTEKAFAAAWAEGQAMALEQAITYASEQA